MKVVLLQDVPKIGKKYEVKEVSAGYASNFLLPRKLAVAASEKAIKEAEVKHAAILAERKIQDDLIAKNVAGLKDIKIVLEEKANETGHLYSKVSAKEISAALKSQHHLDIPEQYIDLAEPIKSVGEHQLSVAISDKQATFTVVIEALA